MKRKPSTRSKRSTRPAAHPSIATLIELRNQTEEQLAGEQDFDPSALSPLREAMAECPAFAPGWLTLGRKSLVSAEPTPELRHERRCFENAVVASARGPEAVSELGWFEHVVADDSAKAEPLFVEAIHRGEATLADSYAGLLSVLQEREDWAQVLELCDRAEMLFPEHVRLMTNVEFARQLARGAKPKPKPKPKKSQKRAERKAPRR